MRKKIREDQKKSDGKNPTCTSINNVGDSNALVLQAPETGQPVLGHIEDHIQATARCINPAAANLLFCQLLTALWLALAKVKASRNQMPQVMKRLAKKVSGLPGRRELDLWIQLVLAGLFELGAIPTKDRKVYRKNCKPLYGVREKHLKAIAGKFGTLRAMQRAFVGSPKREPADSIAGMIAALRRQLENHPDVDLPDAVRMDLNEIRRLVGKG